MNIVKVDILAAYDKHGGFDLEALILDGLLRLQRFKSSNKIVPLTLQEVPSKKLMKLGQHINGNLNGWGRKILIYIFPDSGNRDMHIWEG